MPPCGVWKDSAVPANQVNNVIAAYQADDPNVTINKVANPDGTFNITATFQPCPDGSPSNQPGG
jgi:hypothetical protein